MQREGEGGGGKREGGGKFTRPKSNLGINRVPFVS